MTQRRFALLVIAALIAVLAIVNVVIWQREQLQQHGQRVLLELVPVDPRSLMQGDYMALRFDLGRRLALAPTEQRAAIASDGFVVIRRDADDIGKFVRVAAAGETGESLAADESRLHFRVRRSDVRIVTNAYFFQEGTAAAYSRARFGELRVAANGDALLVGLLDADRRPLGVARKP